MKKYHASYSNARIATYLSGTFKAVAKITTAILADFVLDSPDKQTYSLDKTKVTKYVEKK